MKKLNRILDIIGLAIIWLSVLLLKSGSKD